MQAGESSCTDPHCPVSNEAGDCFFAAVFEMCTFAVSHRPFSMQETFNEHHHTDSHVVCCQQIHDRMLQLRLDAHLPPPLARLPKSACGGQSFLVFLGKGTGEPATRSIGRHSSATDRCITELLR